MDAMGPFRTVGEIEADSDTLPENPLILVSKTPSDPGLLSMKVRMVALSILKSSTCTFRIAE
jgi:hypothetical protein